MQLTNNAALITGGNSGIGLATARLFDAEGARAAITGRHQTTLDGAAKALGPDVIVIKADTTHVEATESVIATVIEKVGPGYRVRQRRNRTHQRKYVNGLRVVLFLR